MVAATITVLAGCSGGNTAPDGVATTTGSVAGAATSADSTTRTDATATSMGSSSTSTPTTTPPPPATVEDWLAADTDVNAGDVLPALAAMLGPIPDVEPLALTPSPGMSITPLVNDAIAHLADYTPEQQAAIEALLAPGGASDAPAGFRRRQDPTPVADMQAAVDGYVTELEAHLGADYPGSSPSVHYVDEAYLGADYTWAEADAFGSSTGIHLDHLPCDIYVGRTAATAAANVQREKLLHEVFHCFQYAYFDGTMDDLMALGGWRVEGTAAWVGLELAGPGPTAGVASWWRTYLAGHSDGGYALPAGYGYHAVGFWAFLANHGIDVWSQVLPVLTAGTQSQAFAFVTGDDTGLLSEWASSTTQEPFGTAWQTTGPGITSDHRTPAEHPVSTSAAYRITTTESQNLQNRVDLYEPQGDVEYMLVAVSGVARRSFGGNGDEAVVDQVSRYCFLEECLCPDNRPPWDGAPYAQQARDPMWIGSSTRAATGTTVTVYALTQDDVCHPCTGTTAPAPSGFRTPSVLAVRQDEGGECPDPCLDGKWAMDNGTLQSEFLRLAGPSISGADVSGQTVWEFDHGRLAVTYGHQFVVTAPLDIGYDLVQTEAFHGTVVSQYHAVAGLFDVWNQTSDAGVNISFDIGDRHSETESELPAGSTIGVEGTYVCRGNDLTMVSAAPVVVTAVLHRINPTE
jgi:hypothetical protein